MAPPLTLGHSRRELYFISSDAGRYHFLELILCRIYIIILLKGGILFEGLNRRQDARVFFGRTVQKKNALIAPEVNMLDRVTISMTRHYL